AVAKPLDLPQREQRVMVDGIDVKRVMADQALEVREFGHEDLENAELVHRGDGVEDPTPGAQDGPEGPRRPRVVAYGDEELPRPSDDVARPLGERDLVALGLQEDVDERRGLLLEERASRDGKLATHDAHAVADRTDRQPAAIGLRRADAAPQHGLAHAVRGRRLAV